MPINRMPLYSPSINGQLFGWFHKSNVTPPKDISAVICPAMGHEYIFSHRSVRHLADHLAEAGISTLRFDYRDTGDSTEPYSGKELTEVWQEDITQAIKLVKKISGNNKICLIGIKLGATLAALASATSPVDYLVLWNPVVKGKSYLRELQVTSATTDDNMQEENDSWLESGGFVIPEPTQTAIKNLDLLSCKISVRQKTLIINRDDLPTNNKLYDNLINKGLECDQTYLPGYSDMVTAYLEYNVVPLKAINHIVHWIEAESKPARPTNTNSLDPEISRSITFSHETALLTETACSFGSDRQLFGILTTVNNYQENPTVVLLNSGALHHVASGRLYVELARNLALHGFNCFRMDIEGLGDSVSPIPGRDYHPYPDYAFDNTTDAIAYLKGKWNLSNFTLAGLCSGAYTALQTAIRMPDDRTIKHIISINPLTFKWVEGETSLDYQQFFNTWVVEHHYSNSVRDMERWKKFFSGKVDYLSIFKLVAAQAQKKLSSYLDLIKLTLTGKPSSELGFQLQTLLKSKSLSFFIASNDPGYELLLRDGGYYARRLIKKGKITVTRIENADHTFSRSLPRRQLIQAISNNMSNIFDKKQH